MTSKKMGEKVNENHILILKEINGKLSVLEEPIKDGSLIINEIAAAVENPNKSLLDVQFLFFNNFHCINNSYHYLYPYSYDSAYITGAIMPKQYSYDEYKKILDERVEERIKIRVQNDKESIIRSEAVSLKGSYAELCIRYIKQQMLYEAFQNAENNSSVKMYSRESIGWTTFIYEITDDLKACVYTNFAYGNSSFFTLTVSYKDIIIVPFSHIIKYYFANMTDIIRCTRGYIVDRDSWKPMFEFVREFANQSLSDPESFIENYLMNEIDEMMKGLRNIMSNPEGVINMFKSQSHNLPDYQHLRFISPMQEYENRNFEVYPYEMMIIFKSEKLSQAVNMLERLRELSKVYSKLDDCIDEILNMVGKLSPEVDMTIQKIQKDIERLTNEKEPKEKKRNEIQSQIDKFVSELNDLLDEFSDNSDWKRKMEISRQYEEENPDYKEMKVLLQDIKEDISKIESQIYSRNSLVNRLSNCADNFGRYMLKSA